MSLSFQAVHLKCCDSFRDHTVPDFYNKRNEVLSLYQGAQGTLDRKEHLVHHGDLICKNIEDCTDALSMHM